MNDGIDPQEFGELRAEVKALRRDVDDMRVDVKALRILAERSTGALWLGVTLASAIGGGLVWIGNRLFH